MKAIVGPGSNLARFGKIEIWPHKSPQCFFTSPLGGTGSGKG